MKAYVIKNKDGKYLTGFYLKDGESEPAFDTKDLTQALLYNEDNYVFYADLGEPVEITIAEGDLEHQLAEKDKEIANIRHQVCEEIKNLAGNYFDMPICENCGEQIVLNDVVLTGNDLIEILNQIEKGETK